MLIAVCLGSPCVHAADPVQEIDRPEPRERDRLHLPSSITLDTIRPVELFPGGTHSIPFNGGQLPSLPSVNHASRGLRSLWRIQIDPDMPTAYHAQYEVVAADGQTGGFSLAEGDSFLPVILDPIEPTLTPWPDGSARLKGGVNLHLALDRIKRSGNYSGTLIVTLHRF